MRVLIGWSVRAPIECHAKASGAVSAQTRPLNGGFHDFFNVNLRIQYCWVLLQEGAFIYHGSSLLAQSYNLSPVVLFSACLFRPYVAEASHSVAQGVTGYDSLFQ